jgi:eukaryotic-like serine/threonine-protein kinase
MPLLAKGNVVSGRYQIISFIGEGGMQEVFLAKDLALGRTIVIKIPKNESAKKRFQRSAAMSARVTHPNVAKTFDYGVDNGHQFLVEEYIEGADLGERLNSLFWTLDPYLCAHALHHLAKGLAAVHREGVTHRDLKPKNIMVSRDLNLSIIKITDFGVAKMAEAEIKEGVADGDATLASQTVVGAIPYMAPEVLRNRDDVSTSADIWSLGAIVYSLLTGELPFGSGLAAVQNIIAATGPPQKPASLKGNPQFSLLGDDLWKLIESCLQVNAKSRPSADQIVASCNALCYSTLPRLMGRIETYGLRVGTRLGFIRSEDGGGSVFFHGDSYWGAGSPAVNERVAFSEFPGSPQPRAHPVLLLRNDE